MLKSCYVGEKLRDLVPRSMVAATENAAKLQRDGRIVFVQI